MTVNSQKGKLYELSITVLAGLVGRTFIVSPTTTSNRRSSGMHSTRGNKARESDDASQPNWGNGNEYRYF